MNLLLVGLSHKSAPVEIRERYSVAEGQLQGIDEKLVRDTVCSEGALISTCNRTELLIVSDDAVAASERAHWFLNHDIGDGSADNHNLYELRDAEAAKHLFRVAASLDSMVLGEAQILGQLKGAHRAALAARSCGPLLNRLFERAFRTAKRVRSETGLGASQVSVARVGVQLAEEVFENFADKRVLLIGAGEMAESALHGLHHAGADDVRVLNRTRRTAEQLAARLRAEVGDFGDLESELARADIAVASVSVERPLLGQAELERCMRGRAGRPLLLIDLGVPRCLDPDANRVDDVYLYDLDDLDEIAARGRARRSAASAPAEAIVGTEVTRYEQWRAGLDAVPVIRELRARAHALALEEVQRGVRHFPDSPEIREALARLAEGIANKLVHRALERLRAEAEEGSAPYFADAAREIFGLQEEDE